MFTFHRQKEHIFTIDEILKIYRIFDVIINRLERRQLCPHMIEVLLELKKFNRITAQQGGLEHVTDLASKLSEKVWEEYQNVARKQFICSLQGTGLKYMEKAREILDE